MQLCTKIRLKLSGDNGSARSGHTLFSNTHTICSNNYDIAETYAANESGTFMKVALICLVSNKISNKMIEVLNFGKSQLINM